MLRDTAVPEGVLVPVELLFVERSPQFERVRERLQFACRVVHEIHVVPDGFADSLDGRDLPVEVPRLVAAAPAVDFEPAVPHVAARLGELGERLWGVETAIVVTMVRRRIRGNGFLVGPEQLVDRSVIVLPGEVPQRDVDRSDTHPVVLPQRPLELRPVFLPLEGVLPNEIVREGVVLRRCGRVPADVRAGNANVRVDLDSEELPICSRSGLVHEVESGLVVAHVFEGILELGALDTSYLRDHTQSAMRIHK